MTICILVWINFILSKASSYSNIEYSWFVMSTHHICFPALTMLVHCPQQWVQCWCSQKAAMFIIIVRLYHEPIYNSYARPSVQSHQPRSPTPLSPLVSVAALLRRPPSLHLCRYQVSAQCSFSHAIFLRICHFSLLALHETKCSCPKVCKNTTNICNISCSKNFMHKPLKSWCPFAR